VVDRYGSFVKLVGQDDGCHGHAVVDLYVNDGKIAGADVRIGSFQCRVSEFVARLACPECVDGKASGAKPYLLVQQATANAAGCVLGGTRSAQEPLTRGTNEVAGSCWFLTAAERGNPATRLDRRHDGPGGSIAWSRGNRVRPLIHGATYFAVLCERIEATGPGDLIFFADWQGDADERLTGHPGSEVVEVLGCALDRGVDVRALVWRSHSRLLAHSTESHHRLGELLQERGADIQLNMRVRPGGPQHQKFVVIRPGSRRRLWGQYRPVPRPA